MSDVRRRRRRREGRGRGVVLGICQSHEGKGGVEKREREPPLLSVLLLCSARRKVWNDGDWRKTRCGERLLLLPEEEDLKEEERERGKPCLRVCVCLCCLKGGGEGRGLSLPLPLLLAPSIHLPDWHAWFLHRERARRKEGWFRPRRRRVSSSQPSYSTLCASTYVRTLNTRPLLQWGRREGESPTLKEGKEKGLREGGREVGNGKRKTTFQNMDRWKEEEIGKGDPFSKGERGQFEGPPSWGERGRERIEEGARPYLFQEGKKCVIYIGKFSFSSRLENWGKSFEKEDGIELRNLFVPFILSLDPLFFIWMREQRRNPPKLSRPISLLLVRLHSLSLSLQPWRWALSLGNLAVGWVLVLWEGGGGGQEEEEKLVVAQYECTVQ